MKHFHILSIIILTVFLMTINCGKLKVYTLLTNCHVYTMDIDNPEANTVLFRGNEIIFAGDMENLPEISGGEIQRIDLDGATVIPGLIDAHAHLLGLGRYLTEVQLRNVESPEKMRQLVMERIKTTEPGKWITGRGWDQTRWEVVKFPTWHDLEGTESNPVILKRVDGHAVLLNSTALKICGITSGTENPPGGEIIWDESGEPTGILIDNACDIAKAVIPEASTQEKRTDLLAAMKECNRYGLTGVGDAWIKEETIDIYEDLIDKGEATLRVYAMLDTIPLFDNASNFREPIIGYGDGMFSLRAIKLFADGALGSRGALFFEPYNDRPDSRGLEITSENDIYSLTLQALEHGFQVCTHAIGDKGNNNTLNGYIRALSENPVQDHRFRVEHVQVLVESDLKRFKEYGIIASMQPTHATSDMDWAEKRIGSERIKYAYAWKTLLDNGAKIAFGSDFPVEEVNPFLGIYAAVTRKDIEGNPAQGWYPEQCLTINETVEAFTVGAAYAQFQEDEIGKLKTGMKADIVVIDRNIFNCDYSEIPKTKILMTIVNGRIVYKNL